MFTVMSLAECQYHRRIPRTARRGVDGAWVVQLILHTIHD